MVVSVLYTNFFSAMQPRPWLLLCVSLHGVAAIGYDFPSWKHGLDYCIAEADTHHRHDSVDRHAHGTPNNMWDADAALLRASPLPQLAGAAPGAPTAQSSPLEPASCFDNPFLEHLRSPLQVHPWPNSPLGSVALPIMGHGISATTQPHSWLATCVPPPTLLGHPILSTPEPSRNGTLGSTTCSSRLASSRPASDMSGVAMAEPLSDGEPVIYSGPQWYYEWLQSADNSTDGDTRHDLPWICEADNAAAALCLDYIRRRGKGSCIRDELHWNYLFSNKNCARVWSVLSGIAFALRLAPPRTCRAQEWQSP